MTIMSIPIGVVAVRSLDHGLDALLTSTLWDQTPP